MIKENRTLFSAPNDKTVVGIDQNLTECSLSTYTGLMSTAVEAIRFNCVAIKLVCGYEASATCSLEEVISEKGLLGML